MLPFPQTIDAAFDALDAFRERLRDADPTSATRLPEWDIDALARHVAAVAWQQGEAFHRARVGATHAPSYLEIGSDQLERAAAHMRSGIDQLDASSEPIVPLPFAALPASFAAAVLLIEYGVHLNDLEHALGETTELREPVADAVVELMGAMLPGLASSEPDRPASFALRTPDATTHVAWRDGSWQSGGEIEPDCAIEGSSSDIALFALGRKPASELTSAATGRSPARSRTSSPDPDGDPRLLPRPPGRRSDRAGRHARASRR